MYQLCHTCRVGRRGQAMPVRCRPGKGTDRKGGTGQGGDGTEEAEGVHQQQSSEPPGYAEAADGQQAPEVLFRKRKGRMGKGNVLCTQQAEPTVAG